MAASAVSGYNRPISTMGHPCNTTRALPAMSGRFLFRWNVSNDVWDYRPFSLTLDKCRSEYVGSLADEVTLLCYADRG